MKDNTKIKLFIVVWTIAFIGISIWDIHNTIVRREIRDYGVEITATVHSLEEFRRYVPRLRGPGRYTTIIDVYVRYQIDRITYHTRLRINPQYVQVGDDIQIYYSLHNPRRIAPAGSLYNLILPWIAIGAVSLWLGIAFLVLLVKRKKKKS